MTHVDTHHRHLVELDVPEVEVRAEEVDETTLRLHVAFDLRVTRRPLPHPLPGVDETLVHPDAEGV